MPCMSDFYELLEVQPRASQAVIQAAFRALMKDHHPDSNETAGRIAVKLNEAYAVLSDPKKRAEYDRKRENIAGRVIGGFRIDEAIAEGGFGKTYKGTHVLVGEPVCIKHCNRISAADTAILLEEAKAMWDLRHFAIPAVRNMLKLDDGSVALVMSYVPGPTLQEVIESYADKNQKLEPEDIAWITERILNVLSYMHRHGVVHGDLKPGNIIIQPESHTVVLVDFGLAAIKPTRTTGSKGYTDLFAPPEQVRGSPLIPQTDFYSLGMTVLYALSGGDASKAAAKRVPETVPDPMCEFISRLLVRDPLARPDWMAENLMETHHKMRVRSFGRANSGMKPLAL